MDNKHEWKYCSLGGVARVSITSGEDIAHLGELDQKLWTVLSCPTDGLNIDSATLNLIDTDHDGKIKVHEVVCAAQWITSLLKDKDSLLKGEETLGLDGINTSTETGQRLYASAKQILSNLGLEKNEISVAEASDGVAIFKGTAANGDGVITTVSAGSDEELKTLIEDCIAVNASSAPTDRSGDKGITEEMIEAFYAACADYAAWNDAADADKESVLPYGANTDAAYKAFCAIKEKVEDFFIRCKLLKYNPEAASAVDNSVEKIAEVSGNGIASSREVLSECPLAKPNAECILPSEGINPAWEDAFNALTSLVGKGEFASAKGTTEGAWEALCSKFAPYAAWLGAKKGIEVEPLGLARVREIIASDRKGDLLSLVADDKALTQEAESIDEVKKMMLLYRDFGRLLRNYVIFNDFYARDPEKRAIFEAGKLYLDQRCCDLCIRVTDMGGHADMAKLSGMFLIYCTCVSKKCGKTMDIVAVMTDGDISELRVGKNGIFYDCEGNDYDATVTKVVDNPVSIRQAFWSPYRKFRDFCVGLINKSASEKDSKIISDMQSKAGEVAANPQAVGTAAAPSSSKQSFDIAKFAGIFAAIGLAIGYIGQFLVKLVKGVAAAHWWQILLVIVVIMLVISGPSCFIAWSKLRKRNLGPVLNANGWAINSKVLVNIIFGSKLTSVAKYPKLKTNDPYARKSSPWKIVLWILLLLAIVFCVLCLTGVIFC